MSQHSSLPIDLLPDHGLQLLASAWPQHIDAHKSRTGLLSQINKHLREQELHPTFTQSTCSQLPVALFGFSVARHQGNLFVYGGRSSADTSSHVTSSHMYCYDAKQLKWHTCKQYNAPKPRRWHSAVVHRDSMLVYGGQCWDASLCEWESTATISSYNFTTSTWSELNQAGAPPSAKMKRCATAAGSALYVLAAAQTGAPAYSILYCYDMDSSCWSMRVCSGPDVPDSQQLLLEQLLHQDGSLIAVFSRHPTAAATAVQQQQQVPGASQPGPSTTPQQQLLSIYTLSLSDNRWHCMPTKGETPSSRTQSCITLFDELLIVSGGTRGAETPLLSDLAFLHLPSRTWHHLQLPAHCQPARACHAAASLGERRLCLLGGWHDGWPSTAPSMVLQRKYTRKQLPGVGLGGSAAGDGAAAANSSRPVVNTELRVALLKAASISAGSDAAGAEAVAATRDGGCGSEAAGDVSAAAGSSSRFTRDMPFCDVTITSAEGVQIRAHRFLLASQSPVFAAMLGPGGMSEAASGTVILPDVSTAVLEALLSYLYGGLPAGIPQELVLELFTAADRFLLPGLAAECVLLLRGCLSAENVALVADLANTHQLQELWGSCVAFAAGPEEQLQVFNSAAYAQLWQDSGPVAQAFTTQVVGLTQQLVSRMKQHLPAAAAGSKELCLRGCTLPALAGAAGVTAAGGGARLNSKRQRTE